MTSAVRVAVGTAVTTAYVPFARVMVDSLRQRHPEVDCFVTVVDGPPFVRPQNAFTALPVEALGIPELPSWRFRYSSVVRTIALKPYLLQALLDRGYERALFIDADVLIVGNVSGLLHPSARAAVTLVPHFALASVDRAAIEELQVLRAGVFNGGCVGVGDATEGRRFLSWWQQRLKRHCRHDMLRGLHFDQRWLDLVPSLFENVVIDRDIGLNVAYWNAGSRVVHERHQRWYVNDHEPARAFLWLRPVSAVGRQPSRALPADG